MTSFGSRLRAAVSERGQLCVGIDPHEALLRDWDLTVDARGVREFALRVVDAAEGRVAVVKPQVSFFERWGAAGFAVLEEVLAAARAAELLVIADAKRGDIGSTMDAYAAAWLTPGAPLEADAVTLSPYLGFGALRGTIAAAEQAGKGVYVLAATSNPEAYGVQSAELLEHEAYDDDTIESRGQSVADMNCRAAGSANRSAQQAGQWGSTGVVLGATVDRARLRIHDSWLDATPILAPGFGAQGARLEDVRGLFGRLTPQVLASASRSILSAGRQGLTGAIDSHNRQLQEGIHG